MDPVIISNYICIFKVWEALVQSQVRLNRQGSGEGSEEGSRKP